MRGHRRSTHHLLTIAVCTALSVGAIGRGSIDWSLCLGDDGHATIELTHGDSECWNDARRHHGPQTTLDIRELEHHGCRDVPLVEGNPGHGPPRVSVADLAAGAWSLQAPVERPAAAMATAPAAPRTALMLRCQRSIVLIV